MFWNKKKYFDEDKIVIEFNKCVFDRIIKTISSSNDEEGGKLLGKIEYDTNRLVLRVESFIDSGPKIDHSSTHLHPDGEYQESVFRVVEQFDSNIEHIGTWHSHHCNGLKNLSTGDIQGYIKTVNNPNYNIDYFLAILVTGYNRVKLPMKYYLFQRGHHEGIEIDETAIRIISSHHPTEEILASTEQLSFKIRSLKDRRKLFGTKSFSRPTEKLNLINKIRVEDKEWFAKHYPKANIFSSKVDGKLYWKWPVDLKDIRLIVAYRYPEADGTTADLKITIDGEILKFVQISLTSERFKKIEEHIEMSAVKIKNKSNREPSVSIRDKSKFKGDMNAT